MWQLYILPCQSVVSIGFSIFSFVRQDFPDYKAVYKPFVIMNWFSWVDFQSSSRLTKWYTSGDYCIWEENPAYFSSSDLTHFLQLRWNIGLTCRQNSVIRSRVTSVLGSKFILSSLSLLLSSFGLFNFLSQKYFHALLHIGVKEKQQYAVSK